MNMLELLMNLFASWNSLVVEGWRFSEVEAPLTVLFVFLGIAICLFGVKVFRPVFSSVVFFGVSAFLALCFIHLLPRYAVIAFVSVLSVFIAFIALFTKRLAIAGLTGLGIAGLAGVFTGIPFAAALFGIAGFAFTLYFKPCVPYIVVSALVGSSLTMGAVHELIARGMLQGGSIFDAPESIALATFLFFACGFAAQLLLSHRGIDPVFKQRLDIDQYRGMFRSRKEDGQAGETDVAEDSSEAQAENAVREEGMQGSSEGSSSEAVVEAFSSEPVEEVESESVAPDADSEASEENVGIECPKVPAVPISELTERAPEEDLTYRKEIKYRLTQEQFLKLKSLLDAYLEYDPYSGPDGYRVRSLYFDSLGDRDLYDKLDGVFEHKKVRIRTYDPAGDTFKLEYKCRWAQDGVKRSLMLDREQVERLIQRDYGVFRDFEPDRLARELYDRMVHGSYIPRVVIEYHRTAWVYPASNIRVTWDQGIEASYFAEQFFEEVPAYIPIIPGNYGVLEIKYDHFFPSVLKDALNVLDQLPVSNSKYALGRTYL